MKDGVKDDGHKQDSNMGNANAQRQETIINVGGGAVNNCATKDDIEEIKKLINNNSPQWTDTAVGAMIENDEIFKRVTIKRINRIMDDITGIASQELFNQLMAAEECLKKDDIESAIRQLKKTCLEFEKYNEFSEGAAEIMGVIADYDNSDPAKEHRQQVERKEKRTDMAIKTEASWVRAKKVALLTIAAVVVFLMYSDEKMLGAVVVISVVVGLFVNFKQIGDMFSQNGSKDKADGGHK